MRSLMIRLNAKEKELVRELKEQLTQEYGRRVTYGETVFVACTIFKKLGLRKR